MCERGGSRKEKDMKEVGVCKSNEGGREKNSERRKLRERRGKG